MTDTTPVRLELYVRTLSPPGARTRQDELIGRLQQLRRAGHVDDTHVRVWGRRVDPTSNAADTDAGQYVLNRIAEFQQWALANNATLDSFYQTSEQSSSITGSEHTAIVLPEMGLAEYHGSELRQVSPCTDPDGTYAITDHLDDVERRLAGPAEAGSAATPVAEE